MTANVGGGGDSSDLRNCRTCPRVAWTATGWVPVSGSLWSLTPRLRVASEPLLFVLL